MTKKKVTYVGPADIRVVNPSEARQEFPDEQLVWNKGETLEIDGKVAEHLFEYARLDFVPFEDPKKRDHRTKAQLLEEANDLEIEGRSSMNKEELLDAIYARRAAGEASDEALPVEEGTPHTQQEAEIVESRPIGETERTEDDQPVDDGA
jgi:hypothetical protein